jgi:hypothetical protein
MVDSVNISIILALAIFRRIAAKAKCPVHLKILHLKMEAIETFKA